MGSLVTLLALARFFAPEPSAASSDEATHARADADRSAEEEGVLRPIVFLPILPTQAAPRDLRNPFDHTHSEHARTRTVKASTTKGASADLRDPFATELRKRHRFDAAPDLRDPFEKPHTLPKCPDTGGVPIQRPDGAAPGCKQASRHRTVFARG